MVFQQCTRQPVFMLINAKLGKAMRGGLVHV